MYANTSSLQNIQQRAYDFGGGRDILGFDISRDARSRRPLAMLGGSSWLLAVEFSLRIPGVSSCRTDSVPPDRVEAIATSSSSYDWHASSPID